MNLGLGLSVARASRPSLVDVRSRHGKTTLLCNATSDWAEQQTGPWLDFSRPEQELNQDPKRWESMLAV
jgi:hypothetical protein